MYDVYLTSSHAPRGPFDTVLKLCKGGPTCPSVRFPHVSNTCVYIYIYIDTRILLCYTVCTSTPPIC